MEFTKGWIYICTAAILTVSALTGCGANAGVAIAATRTEASKKETSEAGTAKEETTKTSEASEKTGDTASEGIQTAAGKYYVKINVRNYGTTSMELYGDRASITVVSFLKLAKDGFYDGFTFHHIMNDFMIQGNDPLSTGVGGSNQEIRGGFSNNGVENPLSHTRGTIFMARSQIKNSASSQFFIVYEGSTFLDGDYARFGYVTGSMEVVGAICEDIEVEGNNGSVAKANQPVIESIEVMNW